MVLDVPPTFYIAQVYDCSTYGAANYNECPATADTPSSGPATSPSTSSGSTSTTTTPDNPETPQTPESTKPSTTEEPKDIALITPAKTIAAMDWVVIVPLALILSVLVAIVILLFKRHQRKPPVY